MMEKRREERYSLHAPIRIKSYGDSSGSAITAVSKDISSKGVFIATDNNSLNELKEKQKVHLELTLTIEKLKDLFGSSKLVTLEIDGYVIRSPKDGVVVEFDKNYSIFPAN